MTGLAAQEITVRLGRRTVLDGVSMAVAPGTFVGLVGPNGAGKTTLLRALAGLVPPDEGRVLSDGADLAALPMEARARRIACLFQAPVVGWPMPAEEIVALGRLPHRRRFADLGAADRAAVERAMRATDTLHLRGRPDTALSAGERMRVLLARALAVEAGMLLADEPVTALDPGHGLDTMALLRELARAGTGVVAVLHDLTLAARFCDRIVVLDRGRVAADGPPDRALTDAVLAEAFGIRALRGRGPAGEYLIPWQRAEPAPPERTRPERIPR